MATYTLLICVVTCILLANAQVPTVHRLQPGVEAFATADQGEWMYFRADQTRNPSVQWLRVTTSACKGRFQLYVKFCHPNPANCEDEAQHLPTANCSACFKRLDAKTTIGQEPFHDVCTTNNFGLCLSNVVYMIGLRALTDDTEVSVRLETFADTDPKPKIYEMDKQLTFDLETGEVRWKEAAYCVRYLDNDGAGCLQNTMVPGARYQLFYTPLDSRKNMGSLCGMRRYGTAVGKLEEDRKSKLEGIKKDVKYLVNVAMIAEGMEVEYISSVVQFSKDIGGSPSEYDPEALGTGWIVLIVILCGMTVMGIGVGIFLFAKSRVNKSMGLYQGIPDAPSKGLDYM